MKPRIVPAILTDKPEDLEAMLRQAESFTSWVQIDIMDGQFVPSRSITYADIGRAKPRLKWEAHLMVKKPETYLKGFHEAGATRAIFHFEATSSPAGVIKQAKSLGLQIGIALNPETPVSAVMPFVDSLECILFLSVNPGFYGAPFIPEVLDKVRELRKLAPNLEIGIDGGMKSSNVADAVKTGANSICVGSAIFRAPDPGAAFRQLDELARGEARARKLPKALSLKEAVIQVIESNKTDGYPPARFIQATQDGYSPNLLQVCDRLITKGETLEYLEPALRRIPTLLTLEDFVARQGNKWNFPASTIAEAEARVKHFDTIAGRVRYD